MTRFLGYRDPHEDLSWALRMESDRVGVSRSTQTSIRHFLRPLEIKNRATHDHSARVGLVGSALADMMHLDPKVLLIAGQLHDLGKIQTPLSTLDKTEGWTQADTRLIMRHVVDGYRMVRDEFDFSAEVILWHHRFQSKGYPAQLPPPLHGYSRGTRVMIPFYGRLLSLCDCYDAFHRINDKHGGEKLDGGKIKALMLKSNPDQRRIVEEAYEHKVFTTAIYPK